MKIMLWDASKNEKLKKERHVSFEEVTARIQDGGLLAVLEHPAPKRYPGQKIFVVEIRGYACLVPFVEADDHLFLKTVIPSRKATKQYLGGEKHHEDETGS